jgi:hypothetical protein
MLLFFILCVSGCDRLPDYRYKMTIFVVTPDGQKAFSSVRQVRVEEVKSLADSSGLSQRVQLEGEAVILDLPDGPIFALLNKPDDRDYGHYIAYAALSATPQVETDPAEQDDLLGHRRGATAYLDDQAKRLQDMVKVKGPRELPRARASSHPDRNPRPVVLWPTFVRFSDLADPTSVQEVSPDEIGVRRVTIEITREPVTKRIFDRLPWLRNQHGSLVQPNLTEAAATQPLSTRITEGSFYRTIP